MVSKSGQIGMIRQLNVKMQEATVWKKTNFSVINEELKKLESKWEMVSNLIDERSLVVAVDSTNGQLRVDSTISAFIIVLYKIFTGCLIVLYNAIFVQWAIIIHYCIDDN